MDIKMSGMNDYEATRLIKKDCPELQIIAQTAHAVFGDKEEVLESGCNDYILKPIIPSELLKIIGNAFK